MRTRVRPFLTLLLLPTACAWLRPGVCHRVHAVTWRSAGGSSVRAFRSRVPGSLSLRGGAGRSVMSSGSGGSAGAGGNDGPDNGDRMIRTPQGMMSESAARSLFEMAGFQPPENVSLQEAFAIFLELIQEQMRQEQQAERPGLGRTAKLPSSVTAEAAEAVLAQLGATVVPMPGPCGCEIKGIDLAGTEGKLQPEVAGAIEVLMAIHGFVLFRNQGHEQKESGVSGQYLSAEQQCTLSEMFGAGKLHSTHGVHPEAPCRDIFRLSNDQNHGFNSVGPEWHNDGSFCREVFGHVVYHIIKAPQGAGDTQFAHLGVAYDKLPSPAVQARLRRCASVNSNGGAVHPMVHQHPLSGRLSLYLHLGMTGAILETLAPEDASRAGAPAQSEGTDDGGFGDGSTPADLAKAKEGTKYDRLKHVRAWHDGEMDRFFSAWSAHLDRPDVSYSHKWQQGDVIIIDNLAVAHKAAPGAHTLSSGLRILHRTTILSARRHDPPPEMELPHTLPTDGPCPFEKTRVGKEPTWVEGYVGFRWGNWGDRTIPH